MPFTVWCILVSERFNCERLCFFKEMCTLKSNYYVQGNTLDHCRYNSEQNKPGPNTQGVHMQARETAVQQAVRIEVWNGL